MDFDTYIGRCDLGDGDPYIVLNDFLTEYFIDIDMSKIQYQYFSDKETWFIEPLNEYTEKIFYTDLKILLQKVLFPLSNIFE